MKRFLLTAVVAASLVAPVSAMADTVNVSTSLPTSDTNVLYAPTYDAQVGTIALTNSVLSPTGVQVVSTWDTVSLNGTPVASVDPPMPMF